MPRRSPARRKDWLPRGSFEVHSGVMLGFTHGAHRTFSPIALALATSFAITLATIPASAEGEEQEQEQALSRARAKFQQANELEQAGNWAGALRRFREVGQVRMTAQVRYHIALCEENLGQLVAALGGYELALANAQDVGPGFHSEVEASIESLRARIPMLTIERGPGAEAATIELDGVSLGASSIGVAVPVDPGPHTLRATAPGYEPFQATVHADERGQQSVSVSLQPSPEPAAAPASTATTGSSSAPPSPAPLFSHEVLTYGSFAAGGLFLAGGGVAFLMRERKLDDAKEICGKNADPSCRDDTAATRALASDALDAANLWEYAGWSSLGVGLVGVGAGTYLLLTQTKDDAATHTSWRLVGAAPHADVGGVSVTGQF